MKREKGITIVALVVTIAILLILAGVTVGTLFGESGIVTKAQEAADLTKRSEAITGIQLEILSKEMERNETGISENEFVTILNKYHGSVVERDEDGEISKVEIDGLPIDMNDIYTGEFIDDFEYNESDYDEITITAWTGRQQQLKASLLQTRIELYELDNSNNKTGAKLILNVGTDYKVTKKKDSNHAFYKISGFSMSFANRWASSDTNGMVILIGRIKKGTKIGIEVYKQGASINDVGVAVDKMIQSGTMNSSDGSIILNESVNQNVGDITDDQSSGVVDLTSLQSVFGYNGTTLKYSELEDYISSDGSGNYIDLVGENGEAIPELIKYIGYDINRDGKINYDDVLLIKQAMNLQNI